MIERSQVVFDDFAGAPTDAVLPVRVDGENCAVTLGKPAATLVLIEVGP